MLCDNPSIGQRMSRLQAVASVGILAPHMPCLCPPRILGALRGHSLAQLGPINNSPSPSPPSPPYTRSARSRLQRYAASRAGAPKRHDSKTTSHCRMRSRRLLAMWHTPCSRYPPPPPRPLPAAMQWAPNLFSAKQAQRRSASTPLVPFSQPCLRPLPAARRTPQPDCPNSRAQPSTKRGHTRLSACNPDNAW